jgi:hypothetical protein
MVCKHHITYCRKICLLYIVKRSLYLQMLKMQVFDFSDICVLRHSPQWAASGKVDNVWFGLHENYRFYWALSTDTKFARHHLQSLTLLPSTKFQRNTLKRTEIKHADRRTNGTFRPTCVNFLQSVQRRHTWATSDVTREARGTTASLQQYLPRH